MARWPLSAALPSGRSRPAKLRGPGPEMGQPGGAGRREGRESLYVLGAQWADGDQAGRRVQRAPVRPPKPRACPLAGGPPSPGSSASPCNCKALLVLQAEAGGHRLSHRMVLMAAPWPPLPLPRGLRGGRENQIRDLALRAGACAGRGLSLYLAPKAESPGS